ncbi:MAG: hypothetical protein WC280_00820 [Patescibacteria group bacterium]
MTVSKIKKISIFVHFLVFLLFFIVILKPSFFYWSIAISNIIIIIFSYSIINLRGRSGFARYLILPIFFINLSFLYSSLLASKAVAIFVLFSATFLLFYYYRSALKYYFIESDKKKNLPVWSNLFGFLTVFIGSAFIYGLPYFLKINYFLLAIFLSVLIFVSLFHNIKIESDSSRKAFMFSLVVLFSLIPISWFIFFLPFNYNVLALILSLFYYNALMFIVLYAEKSLSVKKIKYNIVFSLIFLFLILVSVNWR